MLINSYFLGFCINAAVDRLNLSGRNLTERMRKLLMGAGYMMSTSAEWEIVKDIKARVFGIKILQHLSVFSLFRQYG